MTGLYVYEWRAWDRFLIRDALPEARRLEARIGERAADVLARLPADARQFLFHLNLTDTGRCPLDRAQLIAGLRERGVRVLNGRVTDISKRRVQALCRRLGLGTTLAGAEGDPEEMLIVKSDRNYGGMTEAELDAAERGVVGLAVEDPDVPGPSDYRKARRREIDPALFRLPGIIVERYVENRHDFIFRAFVARDRLVMSRDTIQGVVKKMTSGLERVDWYLRLAAALGAPDAPAEAIGGGSPPAQIVEDVSRFVVAFGLDYGALDIVVDDAGAAYIVDANDTPHWRNPLRTADDYPLARYLSLGLAL